MSQLTANPEDLGTDARAVPSASPVVGEAPATDLEGPEGQQGFARSVAGALISPRAVGGKCPCSCAWVGYACRAAGGTGIAWIPAEASSVPI